MAIQLPDGRLLSDEVLEALRLRALRGREMGLTEAQLADLLGLARETISRWWSAYQAGGTDALPQGRPGRPAGSGRYLTDLQARYIQGLIDRHQPQHLGVPAALWSRRAVAELIRKELGVGLAERTVGVYLRRWGYTPKRPARKARKQDPEEVRRWLQEEYPALASRAEAEGADILWCDEAGVRADGCPGRGYARVGQTPATEVAANHARVNVVSAISNRGEGHFMTFTGALDAAVFILFLVQLLQERSRKVFLVVDRLRAHESAAVRAWVAARGGRIELVPLPRYAPERNVVEYLNNDVKAEVNAGGLPADQAGLEANVNAFLHRLASWPERIMSYFCHPAVQYAAANNV